MSLRPSYPARRPARAPRASARSRSVQASAPIAAAPRANRALRSSRAESATARAASWRRAGACCARLPVLPSSPCALLRALRRAPQASEPPLVAPARCAVCSRAASHRRALYRATPRAAARSGRCGSPSAPSGASPPGSAAPVRGSSRSVGAAFSRALASAGRHPETLVQSCECGVGPAVPLLRPLVLPRPRRRAVAVAAAPAPSPGSPPCAVPLFPPPVRAAGRLRGAPVGRAGACARCARLSPAAPPPAWAASWDCVREFRARSRAETSPPTPPRPSPPLGVEGGARPAAPLRRDGGCSEGVPALAACVLPL